MTPGAQPGKIDDETDELTIVAKYAPIPDIAQTGDSGNWWWLLGVAVIAALGALAYAASRKQKGVRC